MARNGLSTLLYLAQQVCRIVGIFGVEQVRAEYGDGLANALQAVQVACMLLKAQDDHAFKVDRTPGSESFDGIPAG